MELDRGIYVNISYKNMKIGSNTYKYIYRHRYVKLTYNQNVFSRHFFTAILRDGLHVAAGHVLPQLPQRRGTSGTAFEVVVLLHGAKPDLPRQGKTIKKYT